MSIPAEPLHQTAWFDLAVPPRLSDAERDRLSGYLEQLRVELLRPTRDARLSHNDPAFASAMRRLVEWAGRVAHEVGLDVIARLMNLADVLLDKAMSASSEAAVTTAFARLREYQEALRPYLPQLLANLESLQPLPPDAQRVVDARVACELTLMVFFECLEEASTTDDVLTFWRGRLEEESAALRTRMRATPWWTQEIQGWVSGRLPLRLLTTGPQPGRADVTVFAPDAPDLWLVVEVCNSEDGAPVAESWLKQYMLRRRCPTGLLVTRARVVVYRDAYAGDTPDSIRSMGELPTKSVLSLGDAEHGDATLAAATSRWLMRLGSDDRRAMPTDPEASALVQQHVLPWVQGGRVVVESAV